MTELITILSVAGLFLIRVGIPLVMLIVLGLLVDRWQTRRNEEIKRQIQKHSLELATYKKEASKRDRAA